MPREKDSTELRRAFDEREEGEAHAALADGGSVVASRHGDRTKAARIHFSGGVYVFQTWMPAKRGFRSNRATYRAGYWSVLKVPCETFDKAWRLLRCKDRTYITINRPESTR